MGEGLGSPVLRHDLASYPRVRQILVDDANGRRRRKEKKRVQGGIPRANKASEHRSSKELLQGGFVFPLLQVKGGNKGRAVIIVALWNIPQHIFV